MQIGIAHWYWIVLCPFVSTVPALHEYSFCLLLKRTSPIRNLNSDHTSMLDVDKMLGNVHLNICSSVACTSTICLPVPWGLVTEKQVMFLLFIFITCFPFSYTIHNSNCRVI